MTLKTILDNVAWESGMDTETVYATSTDDAVLRMVALANRSANRITSGFEWQLLRKTHSFSMTTATSYDLPTDFHELIPDTAFANSYIYPVDMRTRPSLWRYLQVNNTGTGPRYRARIIGDKLEIYQPKSGETISFEYTSDYPIETTGGVPKKRFTLDTDEFRLDDDLITMDLVWRYKKLLGLQDWQVDHQDFKSYERTVQGNDAGAKTIYGSDGSEYPVGIPYTDLWPTNS